MCVLQALQGVAEVNADIMSHLHSALICTVVYFPRHRHCGVGDGNGWHSGCDSGGCRDGGGRCCIDCGYGLVVEMIVIVVDVVVAAVVVVVVEIEFVAMVVMRL